MRDNTGNLYPAWEALGTRLKLIPMVGGIDQNVLLNDIDGKTAFEKEIDYFGERMQRYPSRNVIYEGKPLVLIYLGAAQDPASTHHPLWYQIGEFLKKHPAITNRYTFRMMAGYLDSQPGLWAKQGVPNKPIKIAPKYHFWSWVDRLKTSCSNPRCPYFPTYNEIGARVENFTAAIAYAGQNGWSCPHPGSPPYCDDDGLRFDKKSAYATFEAYMAYARQLDPIFLFIHQFNEFGPPDEGFDANTEDDIEPANLWGNSALDVVQREVRAYHDPPDRNGRQR